MENDCVVCLMYIMSVRMQKGSSIIAYKIEIKRLRNIFICD